MVRIVTKYFKVVTVCNNFAYIKHLQILPGHNFILSEIVSSGRVVNFKLKKAIYMVSHFFSHELKLKKYCQK